MLYRIKIQEISVFLMSISFIFLQKENKNTMSTNLCVPPTIYQNFLVFNAHPNIEIYMLLNSNFPYINSHGRMTVEGLWSKLTCKQTPNLQHHLIKLEKKIVPKWAND
uniref:Uncharacterized protein n=1 Tax=Arundo donax TaxID=35708 RepID=A0A0A9DPJ1_ARUDO